MISPKFLMTAWCVWLLGGPWLASAQEREEIPRKRTYGIRVEAYPFRLFTATNSTGSTTKPIADYTYSGRAIHTSPSVAPTFEWHLRPHLSIGAEFRFQRPEYEQTSEMRSGKPDPNSATDDRLVSTIRETTRPNYWEFPVIARYYRFPRIRYMSKTYFVGGAEYLHVGHVRTGTEYSYADGVTDYNESPKTPTRRNQVGFVAGIGMRFIDEFGIRIAPEIRYTRWVGNTFVGGSIRSVTNQLEGGLGISF